jgi:hypothetical protein
MKDLDRRWIFLCMGLLVLVFLRLPVQLDYAPSRQTRGVYEAVEALAPGERVYLAVDYGPASQAELLPMHEAFIYHLLRRGNRVIAASTWDSAPPITDAVFAKVVAELEKENIHPQYGVDYINLGFKTGQDVAIAKIGSSIPEAFPLDYRMKPVRDLPIMKGVENFEQIALLCSISAGSPGARQWLQQVQTRYRVRMVAGVTAVMSPDLYSFFQSRQLVGFLGGLVGAAEYEYLLKRPALAMGGMNVQSIAHLLILAFVVWGNIVYFHERRRKRRHAVAAPQNREG